MVEALGIYLYAFHHSLLVIPLSLALFITALSLNILYLPLN